MTRSPIRAVSGVAMSDGTPPVVIAYQGADVRVMVPGMSECPLPVAHFAWGRRGRGAAYLAWHVLAALWDDDVATCLWADFAEVVISRLHPCAFLVTREQVERFVVGMVAELDPSAIHSPDTAPEEN